MDAMSCLAPQPASFLPTAASPAYYTDAAIARALHYMPDHYSYSPAASSSSPSSSSSLLADLPFSGGNNWFTSTAATPAPTAAPPTGLTCDSVLVASDVAPRPSTTPVTPVAGAATNKRRVGLGPAAGRAGKRRPRASKRAPTTYISTDPSNFRLMVQHVTGVQADPAGDTDGTVALQMPASFDASSAAGLLDCHPAFDGASFGDALRDGDAAAALHHRLQQQQQQQPCYPTLDSWSVMYESAELL